MGITAVKTPLQPETLHPYRCSSCGDIIEHVVTLHFRGRTLYFHLACLLDNAAVMSLLLPLVPCAHIV